MAKKPKVKLLDDRVLIQAVEAEETTAGGIVLPDAAREKQQRGKVLAVGPGKLMEKTGARGKMSVSVGDEVFYGKYAGTEVDVDGEELVIVRENDILAVIE
jgi:chaperonin GroES